jgi:hypothetical protein
VQAAGGEVRGGVNSPEGLVERVRKEFGTSRADAQTAIEAAIGETIAAVEVPGAGFKHGGKPARVYRLNLEKKYEK